MRQCIYLMKEIKRTFSYLLTFSPLPWRYSGKQFGVVDCSELRMWIVQTWLESGFTANELRFADYCDCRKRERKSDYQRRYRYSELPGSR